MKQTLRRGLTRLPYKQRIARNLIKYRHGIPRELLVPSGTTIVQAGMWREANARKVIRLAGANATVVFIDMNPDAINAAKQAAEHKHATTTVHAVHSAVWDEAKQLEAIIEEDPAVTRVATGRGHAGASSTAATDVVDTDTIANICANLDITGPIGYCEITVNGAELEALRGMGDMLSRTELLWVAGMTINNDGTPINQEISAHLKAAGFKTRISKTSSIGTPGNVLAWR